MLAQQRVLRPWTPHCFARSEFRGATRRKYVLGSRENCCHGKYLDRDEARLRAMTGSCGASHRIAGRRRLAPSGDGERRGSLAPLAIAHLTPGRTRTRDSARSSPSPDDPTGRTNALATSARASAKEPSDTDPPVRGLATSAEGECIDLSP
jgi:hypothetical protein